MSGRFGPLADDRRLPRKPRPYLVSRFCSLRGFRLGRRCINLLRVLQRTPGEFVSLLAEFVCGKMIPLAVRDRCGGVGVRCEIVKFCGLIV